MPQQKNPNNSAPSIGPRLNPDDFAALWGDNPQPPTAPSGGQPIYLNTGAGMVPVDPTNLANFAVDPAKDLSEVMRYQPSLNEGPYAPGATGETAREYQAQYRSPYVTALAQHLGVSHPRLAGFVDEGVLGLESAQASHERALAANGGIEGAGGGIADALAGLTGPAQMRLAHREQLEQLPLQYAQEQGGLEQQQATTLAERMRALSEYESNPARILSMVGRGTAAAQIGSNERLESTRINVSERYQQALNSDANKLAIAHLKGQYSRSNAMQQERMQQSFLGSYRAHLDGIDRKYDQNEMRLQLQKNSGLLTPQQYDAQHTANEDNRQAEKQEEAQYFDHASGQIFGRNLLQPQPTNAPRQSKQFTVVAPNGKTYVFPSQAAANRFKKSAGIK